MALLKQLWLKTGVCASFLCPLNLSGLSGCPGAWSQGPGVPGKGGGDLFSVGGDRLAQDSGHLPLIFGHNAAHRAGPGQERPQKASSLRALEAVGGRA